MQLKYVASVCVSSRNILLEGKSTWALENVSEQWEQVNWEAMDVIHSSIECVEGQAKQLSIGNVLNWIPVLIRELDLGTSMDPCRSMILKTWTMEINSIPYVWTQPYTKVT